MCMPGCLEHAKVGLDGRGLSGGAAAAVASEDFAVHYAWLPSGQGGIECIADLANLPASGDTLVVGAPKAAGATGGPARPMALV